MTNNANVQPIKHKDVRGKEMLYLGITVNDKNYLISIGERTFNAVAALINPKISIPNEKGGKK